MQRDSLFFPLYDAFDPEHCAICHLGLHNVQRFLDTYLYERITDSWSRAEFIAARGFCAVHGWQLGRSRDSATGVTIIYEHLLREFSRVFGSRTGQHLVEAGGNRRFPWAERPNNEAARALRGWLEPQQPCPACRSQWDAEERYLATLAEMIFDDDLRSRYSSSLGLCLRHLTRAMDQITRSDDLEWLVRTERRLMDGLLRDLKEFWRKHDYRFHDEPISRGEATSWRRVLYKVGGGIGMVWRG